VLSKRKKAKMQEVKPIRFAVNCFKWFIKG